MPKDALPPAAAAADQRKTYRKYKAHIHLSGEDGRSLDRPVQNGDDYLFDTHDDALKAGIDELVRLGVVVVEPTLVRRKVDVSYEEVAP